MMAIKYLVLLLVIQAANCDNKDRESVLKELKCNEGNSIEFINSIPWSWQDESTDTTNACSTMTIKCASKTGFHYKRLPFCVLRYGIT